MTAASDVPAEVADSTVRKVPAELPAAVRPQRTVDRVRKGPGRKAVLDQEYADAVREVVDGAGGSMPSARELARQLSIGQDRARRLVATLSAEQNGSGGQLRT
jgi:hypothetical protein